MSETDQGLASTGEPDARAGEPGPAPEPEPEHEPEQEPEEPSRAPDIADGQRHPLAPEHVPASQLVGWIVSATIGGTGLVALVVAVAVAGLPLWLDLGLAAGWLVLAAGLAWLGHRWPEWEHPHLGYRVSSRGVDVWKGLVWRSWISVPRSRVQHTEVLQGPIQRRFGLATLTIHTAGQEHAQVAVEGLAHGTALAIRDYLLESKEGRGGRGDGDVV